MALEDLAEFFDVDEHAQAASYTPSGGSASSISVIFRNEFYLEDGCHSGNLFDFLGIDSTLFCGATGPSGVNVDADQIITFESDSSSNGIGFKLCFSQVFKGLMNARDRLWEELKKITNSTDSVMGITFLKYLFTLPGPARCAAANIPLSVISVPSTTIPE